ncbi:hypothetical protein KSP40_PGU021605 [Platanthera guangdongensis]|uniref:Uncharacterized protein n=1 Tax=Platanthera guangdongensis TaxID=2320717 RepID=A0ABR2MY73_9ASPA
MEVKHSLFSACTTTSTSSHGRPQTCMASSQMLHVIVSTSTQTSVKICEVKAGDGAGHAV